MSIFRKLFPSSVKPSSGPEPEFAEFKEGFFLKPGILFMDFLRQERVNLLIDWFAPTSEYPEPKAFIRMVNDTTRRGVNIWDQTGITMNLESGPPSLHSQECFSLLAQVLAFPITTYFRASTEGELQKQTFSP